MTTYETHGLSFAESLNTNNESGLGEEVPCLDAIAPNLPEEVNTLKSCILNRLRRQCAKSLAGPWSNPQNVDIEQVG